jgi:hypothetical protein
VRDHRGNRDSDPFIETYKKDLDRTLLAHNRTLTPEQRIRQLMELQRFAEELRRAGHEARRRLQLPGSGRGPEQSSPQ